MKRLQQHWAKREQQRWETAVAWFRVRYREASGVGRSARLLSGPVAGGRVALRYQPGAVSQLWLGVPLLYAPLLWQMADDFGFVLHQETVPPAEPELLAAAADLPWGTAVYRPHRGWQPLRQRRRNRRSLLALAKWGETNRLAAARTAAGRDGAGGRLAAGRAARRPAAHLRRRRQLAVGLEPGGADAGRARAGQPVRRSSRRLAGGRVDPDHRHRSWRAGHPRRVGDLAPRLKRKPAVTRLLGRGAAEGDRLHYLDIDGAAVIDGFDPLAAVGGESESRRRARRRQWFRLMGVHRTG
ncbi:MAG: hypothetical protein IPM39_26050 [Chloroflexi bacterium]|nr:hypothetical protein [Chloroflexota bacterium]